MHHVQECLIVHILANYSGNLLYLLKSDKSFLFLIVEGKYSFKSILCFVLSNTRTHAIDELLKVEWFVFLPEPPDYILDERASFVKIEFFEYFVNFYWIYFPTSILIEKKECVSETFVILSRNSFSPGDGDRFFCLFLGFRLATEEEIGTFIHFIELKI